MNIKAIISIILAIAVAVGLTFGVDKFILSKEGEFDPIQTAIHIIIVLVVVGIGAWVATKVTKTEALQVKAKV